MDKKNDPHSIRKSINFFEDQFQRQVEDQDYSLNPFEALALEYLKGSVLDLGCGLGNLSLEAGRLGHRVLAIDGSATAVERINRDAKQEGVAVQALQVDLKHWSIDQSYETIVAIGLLMFFHRNRAFEILHSIQKHTTPGGRVILNVLIEGTTYMDMFDPKNYHLFRPQELEEEFSDWVTLTLRRDSFPAPKNTQKDFLTIIAEKPEG